jgi:hypothetical protein
MKDEEEEDNRFQASQELQDWDAELDNLFGFLIPILQKLSEYLGRRLLMISHFSLERSKKKVRRSSQRWQPGAGFSLAETVTIKKRSKLAIASSKFPFLSEKSALFLGSKSSRMFCKHVSQKQIMEDLL